MFLKLLIKGKYIILYILKDVICCLIYVFFYLLFSILKLFYLYYIYVKLNENYL